MKKISVLFALASCFLLIILISTSYSKDKVEIRILYPKDGEKILLSAGENIPAEREIRGDIKGLSKKEIEELGLLVSVSIQTDKWYPQGIAQVRQDGTWALKKGYFGGAVHVIKADLKDKNDNELATTTATVTIIQP